MRGETAVPSTTCQLSRFAAPSRRPEPLRQEPGRRPWRGPARVVRAQRDTSATGGV